MWAGRITLRYVSLPIELSYPDIRILTQLQTATLVFHMQAEPSTCVPSFGRMFKPGVPPARISLWTSRDPTVSFVTSLFVILHPEPNYKFTPSDGGQALQLAGSFASFP